MKLGSFLSASLVVFACVSVSQATAITVLNPSFEAPVQADGSYTNRLADNWAQDAGGTNAWGAKNPVASEFTGAAGNNVLDPIGGDGINYLYLNSGQTSQTLAATLESNMIYDLTVAVGHRLETSREEVNYYIRLYAGTTLLGEVAGNTSALTSGVFTDKTVSYTSSANDPLAGQALKIVLGTADPHASRRGGFDKVRLDATAVPEPATMALLGLGAFGLIRRRR